MEGPKRMFLRIGLYFMKRLILKIHGISLEIQSMQKLVYKSARVWTFYMGSLNVAFDTYKRHPRSFYLRPRGWRFNEEAFVTQIDKHLLLKSWVLVEQLLN